MANDTELSPALDPKIRVRLEQRASWERTSASSIVERASEASPQTTETKNGAILEAVREADEGVFISGDFRKCHIRATARTFPPFANL